MMGQPLLSYTEVKVPAEAESLKVTSLMPSCDNSLNSLPRGAYGSYQGKFARDRYETITLVDDFDEVNQRLQRVLAEDFIYRSENQRLPHQIDASLANNNTFQRLINPSTRSEDRGWFRRLIDR
jgi:hypothetical protein